MRSDRNPEVEVAKGISYLRSAHAYDSLHKHTLPLVNRYTLWSHADEINGINNTLAWMKEADILNQQTFKKLMQHADKAYQIEEFIQQMQLQKIPNAEILQSFDAFIENIDADDRKKSALTT